MPATIDVLLPVRNAASFLVASLESLSAQTCDDFRVLILDDGSDDGSLELARAHACRDPRFEVHAWPHRGLVATLNAGLDLVTAPYIARQDADDLSVPGRFAMQLAYLRAHPEVCAASGLFVEMGMDGAPRCVSRWLRDPGEVLDPFCVPAEEPYLPHPFLMLPTAELRAAGGYRAVLHSEDADLFWRLSLRGRLANLPNVLGVYRLHRQSVSAQSLTNATTQAFFAQIAALSYRRVICGLPDLPIDTFLAEAVARAASIEAKCACFPGLNPAEAAYLHLAAYAKTIDTIRVRSLPFEPGLVRDAMTAYRAWRGLAGRRGNGLRRRIRRGIRHNALQNRAWTTTLGLTARYVRDVLLEPLWRRLGRRALARTGAAKTVSRVVPPTP